MLKRLADTYSALATNDNSTWFAVLHIVLLILIAVTLVLFFNYLTKFKIVERLAARFKNNLEEQERLRNEEFDTVILMEGEQQKIPFMKSVDIFLVQSGIKYRIPGLAAESFIVFMVFLAVVSLLLGTMLSNSIILGCIASATIVTAIYLFLYFKRSVNFKRTEEDVMKFVNLLENINYSETRLDRIFRRAVPYLKRPLKDIVEEFCHEVDAGISEEMALNNMIDRVDHKKLKILLKSFQVANSKEQNYSEIIEENREVMREYISERKERENIKKNAFIDLVIIAAAGLFVIHLFSSMVENIYALMFTTFAGQLLCLYLFIIFIWGIIAAVKTEK